MNDRDGWCRRERERLNGCDAIRVTMIIILAEGMKKIEVLIPTFDDAIALYIIQNDRHVRCSNK